MALTKVSNSMLVQPVNHNILINPSFTVMQRGDVVDHNEQSYGPDRWGVVGVTEVGGTMSQSTTDSSSGINKLVIKHRNATSHAYTYQNIEAVNLLGLYGKEITFSFSYSDMGGSGIPKVKVGYYDPLDTFKELFHAVPTSLGDNRWSCTVTLITEGGTIPDPSEVGLQVTICPNEKNTAPNEWSVWETKLEVGSVATPFIARPYGEELALCQRYYQTVGIGKYKPLSFRGGNENSADGPDLMLPTPMRSIPTGGGGMTGVNTAWWDVLNSASYNTEPNDWAGLGVTNATYKIRLSNAPSISNSELTIRAPYGANITATLDAEL
jgi:hypothetical protein